ncbi:MAG TPA: hypothetical protein VHD90_11980 [Phototrophicaceae bacterium]|nr:hypothetical protein [Phototrophicaceae bacterium]
MSNLARIDQRPSMDGLSEDDKRTLAKRFDANAYEINVDGHHIEWRRIDEVEVAKAARQSGPSGWFVKNVVFAGDRYHVGVYFGRDELVLTNVTLEAAKFVVQTIAYYANNTIRYTGVEGIAPVTEG